MPKYLLVLLLFLPLVLRGVYVDNFIYHYTSTRFLGFSQVLANDAIFYGSLLAMIYVSLLPQINRFCTALLRGSAFVLWLVYIADYVVINYFNTHLTLGDTLKYAHYAYQYIQQMYGLNTFSMVLLIMVILLPSLWLALSRYKITPKFRKLPVFMLVILPIGASFSDNQKYAHSWIYKNVIDYNLTILSESSPYSDKFAQTVPAQESLQCQPVQPQRKNIIIVMVESLSSYQSQYFSGIKNWTPNLDHIASQNQAFKNFYANGFITEDGEIALLTGINPIYPPSSYTDDGGTSFYSFFNIQDSLPARLKKYAYQSEFLTSADLDFGNTGNWAKSIGFDYIEGHDHPDYDRWERFHFKSAPDEALYLRALDRVKQQQGRNFLLFIKTVSSHHPYMNPENKHKSEAETIQYTDKQLGRFYRQLQKNGFFEQGLLVIVGDHHSMTPLKNGEVEQFGQFKASAKVPLVIADGKTVSTEDRQFQQIDVFNSLQGLVSGQFCHSEWKGVLLGTLKTPPKYIAHRRGDNRDIVSVFTEDSDFLIKLDGDATRLLGKSSADEMINQGLINKINILRINRINWLQSSAERAS